MSEKIEREKKDPIFFLVWTLVLVSVLANVLVVGFIGTRFFTIKKDAADFTKLSTVMESFIRDLQLKLTDEKSTLLPMLDQKSVTKIGESKGLLIEKGIELEGSTKTEKEILVIYEEIRIKTEDIKQIRADVLDWRKKYNVILKDILEEKTLKTVLQQYGLLNSSVKILEGTARLKQARILKKLKKKDALNDESQVRDDLIKSVKNPLGTKLRRINKELSQIELNIEKLSSEDQVDQLIDLKDNKIRQGIDRLGKDISFLERKGIDLNDLTTSNLQTLTSTIFGEGYIIDYDHQFIKLGAGGLYSLQRNRLLLLQSRSELLKTIDKKFAEINHLVANIRKAAEAYLSELTDKQNKNFTSMWKNSLFLSAIFLTIFLVLAWYILQNIKRQIQQKKDAEINLEKESEIAVKLKDEALASADELEKKAEELNQSNLQLEEQTKLKTSMADLSDQMRGELEPSQLGDNILNFLVPYLNAQIGLFYVVHEENILNLVSTYAHSGFKNLDNKLKFGETLVGQSALEKKTMVIKDIPEKYFMIHSSLGEIKPRTIILIPILFDQKVKGILEIGTLKDFSDMQIQFLDQVNENIGINLNSSLVRLKVKGILEKSQEQAEALQSQQEELRASNEELEEQSKALREMQTKYQKG